MPNAQNAQTENKSNNHNIIRLGEIWGRLDSLCLKLWQEDRVAAVGLQAIIEEFRGEIARSEQMLEGLQKALTEQRHTLEMALEARLGQEKSKWQEQANTNLKRISVLEEALQAEKTRGETLLKRLEQTERTLDDVKDQSLKREAELDSKHANKMRELYEELQKKEATEESFWLKQRQEWEEEKSRQNREMEEKSQTLEARAKQLEHQYQQKIGEMQKKYESLLENVKSRADNLEHEYNQKASELVSTYTQLKKDLESREIKTVTWEGSVRQRETSVDERARELEAAYQKKCQDLEKIKEELKSEVGRIVRDYRTRQTQAV